MADIQAQLEGLPGFSILQELWDGYAEEHFNSIDPYEDKNGNKRKLPKEFSTVQEQKMWKKVQKKAWTHDKCFMGSCGVGMDCGLGLAPIVVLLFPVIGPLVMYAVHARLIHVVTNEMKLPTKLVTKMEGQIFFDLLITFPPVIGCFFGYLNACSTRNAGMIYKYFEFLATQRAKNNHPTYLGTGAIGHGDENNVQPNYKGTARAMNYSNPEPTKPKMFRKAPQNSNDIYIQNQQQSGFV